MKKKYSPKWKSSSQRRKQRKYRANAPLHKRQKMVSAHLSKELRGQYKRRSLPLRKGDEVKVMKGEFKGTYGKVDEVDLKNLKVRIDGIKRRKVSGEEVAIAIDPSNLLLTRTEINDKRRITMKKIASAKAVGVN